MDYWEGFMNWPVKVGWVCETCGEYKGMTWGIPHAVCSCNVCHTVYRMRDDKDAITDTPISQLKDEYKEAAKLGFTKLKKPISEFSIDEWKSIMEEV